MVMSQMGITAEAVLSTLRTHAWTHDRLLTDIANDVVAHTLTFSLPEDALGKGQGSDVPSGRQLPVSRSAIATHPGDTSSIGKA